ncbi:fosfomycin resistance protein FosB [compost metagenome]
MLCKKLSHAAYRCKDAKQTAEFYTRVLGLKLSHVMGAERVPSTQEVDPHIHVFFELEDGSSIAFFEAPLSPGDMRDTEMRDWIQHFAFQVADMDEVIASKSRLEALGIDVLGPTDHDGYFFSIYFHDPNGHRLELTAHTASPEMKEAGANEAPALLKRWSRHSSWEGNPPNGS